LHRIQRPLLILIVTCPQLLASSPVEGAPDPLPQPLPAPNAIASCRPVPTFQEVGSHLDLLRQRLGDRIATESIGRTSEGRDILLVHLYPDTPSKPYPTVLGIFGQHGNEHDSTVLGLDLLDRLAEGPPLDFEVDILPQMNPDGAEADHSGCVPPLSCRKNRRLDPQAIGVDLNRNWGYGWTAGLPPSSSNYPGPGPFSEPETQAVRDWMQRHRNVQLAMDVHSGHSSFDQGFVLFPYSCLDHDGLAPADRTELGAIASDMARTLTDPADTRTVLPAIQSHEVRAHVERAIHDHVPVLGSLVAWALVPPNTIAPGASIDWLYGSLGIPAFGIELLRPSTPADIVGYAAVVQERRQGHALRLERWGRALRPPLPRPAHGY